MSRWTLDEDSYLDAILSGNPRREDTLQVAILGQDPFEDDEPFESISRSQVQDFIKSKSASSTTSYPGLQSSSPSIHAIHQLCRSEYEIRVLELKPGFFEESIEGILHHVSVEFDYQYIPNNYGWPDTTSWRHATNHAVSLSEGRPIIYTALSYFWGPPNFNCAIRINGQELRITQNLDAAIRHLRHQEHSVMLWIDQICIDQSDVQDKESQIGLMSRIYGCAWNTVIWLGDEPEDGALSALRGLHEATQYSQDTLLEHERETLRYPLTEDPKAFKQLAKLLDRPWFRQTWIVQEAVLSLAPYLMTGYSTSPWEDFAGCCQSLRGLGLFEPSLSHPTGSVAPQMSSTPSGAELVGLLWDKKNEYRTFHADPDLFSTLVPTRHAEFTNPLDKVYGILGFCRHNITVDYSRTTASLFEEVTVDHLTKYPESFENGLLGHTVRVTVAFEVFTSVDHEKEDPDLPSWVPDWSKRRSTTALAFSTSAWGYYKAGGNARHDVIWLNAQDHRLTI